MGFQYRFYPDSTKGELVPEYLFEKAKIREQSEGNGSKDRQADPPGTGAFTALGKRSLYPGFYPARAFAMIN